MNGFLWCITEVCLCVCVYIMDLNCAIRRTFLLWIMQTSQPSVRFVLWFLFFSTNLLAQRPIQQTFSHFNNLLGQNRAFLSKQCPSSTNRKHQKHTISPLEPKSDRFAKSSPAQRYTRTELRFFHWPVRVSAALTDKLRLLGIGINLLRKRRPRKPRTLDGKAIRPIITQRDFTPSMTFSRSLSPYLVVVPLTNEPATSVSSNHFKTTSFNAETLGTSCAHK